MATRSRGVYRGGAGLIGRFRLEASQNPVAGQVLIRNAAATTPGEIENPTTTAAADMMGIALEAATYSATQADFDGFPGYRLSGEEGTVGIVYDALQIVRFVVAGGATAGTALATTAPANILTNTSADTAGLTITAAEVGTVDMDGGLVIGRTGNNGGVVKRLTTHSDNTSDVVIEPFPRTIAANDTFIRVPYSKSTQTVQLTSNFVEANGIIAFGTGAAFVVVDVDFDIVNDEVVIEAVSGDHYLNPA